MVRERYSPDLVRKPPVNNPPNPGQSAQMPEWQVEKQMSMFLVSAGALVRVMNSGLDAGAILVNENWWWTPEAVNAVPTVVMRMEDYGRITRILADGTPVELEAEIENQWYPDGRRAHNVLAELPGADKKEEVVMLGAHLDSLHGGTGAEDDAIGCAVVMEAMRLLKTIGARPRRTIRVALWGGEEQGMQGSKAYVKQHLGSFETPKPEAEGFVAYFNVAMGAGRPRGMEMFTAPQAAVDVLREILKPFADLGVVGARGNPGRAQMHSDHGSFNVAGFTAINVWQDPIVGFGHTNLDTYERIILEDAQKAATVMAATVYELANRDERLPRLSEKEMPAPPPVPQGR